MSERTPRVDRAAARSRVGQWLLVVVVVGSVLALGTVHTSVLLVCALGAGIATSLLWWDAEPFESRPAANVLLYVGIALIAWTALQAVPLPLNALSAIAPANADVWARCLFPLHEAGPGWAPITLDPIATRVQVLRGVTYVVVFLGGLRIARSREGTELIERLLVGASLAVAASAIAHPLFGAQRIFGIYEPKETIAYDPQHLGPLLDTNHLAAYSNIGLLIAFASLLGRRDTIPRVVAVVIVILLSATTVWSASRGGIATMLAGIVLVTALSLRGRDARAREVAGPIAVGLVSIVGVGLFLGSAFEVTRLKVLQNDLQKVDLVQNSFELLRPFGVLGLGRGAYESVFPAVRRGSEYLVFTHPEDVLAQWSTEWGAPVALAAFIALAWALRPRTALARSRPPIGPWTALAAVALQNLVDFSSEVPGVMLALCLCAAAVAGGTGGLGKARAARWGRRPRWVAYIALGGTVIAAASVLPFIGQELYDEKRSFGEIGLDRALSRDQFHDRARAAMQRHPAEAYLPYVGALRAAVVGDESVLPWAARALERSPVFGRVHLLLARALFVRGPAQARLEYRTACTQDRKLCAIDESVRLVHDFDDAEELVPTGDRGVDALARLTDALALRLPSTVVRLDEETIARDPLAPGPVRRVAEAALRDVKNDESWCAGTARTECLTGGLSAAERVRDANPRACEGHALVAELRIAAGDVDRAFAELAAALGQVDDHSACARRFVNLAVAVGGSTRVEMAVDRLLKIGCDADECAENLMFASRVEASRGGKRSALLLTKKATERAPERDDLLETYARDAETQGVHGDALAAYTRLAERHPQDERWSAAVARERDAATKSLMDRP